MRKKIIALFAALVMAFSFTQVSVTPAEAGTSNNVRHAPDDTGYNEPIRIVCQADGTYRYLGLGIYSTSAGKCPGAGYVADILPLAGYLVRCVDQNGVWRDYYAGNSYVANGLQLQCYHQVR